MIEKKFKHTDIGLLPEEWEVSTFGKEFKKLNAASYTWSETFKDGSCAYLHYGEIHTKYHDHLDVQHSDLPFISKNQAKRFNKLQNGDLIMLNASEDYDGVNDCVEIINCDKELVAGQHTIPLRPISNKLVKGFIGYIPSIPAVRMQLIENAVGTKVYGVTNEMLQTVLLPIPTRHEQQRIASALMKVDALISNLGKLIQKKQAIKKGAMQELLTGKKRLPGFKGEWKEYTLENLFNFGNGYTPSKANPLYWSNGTLPWFRMDDIRIHGRILKDSIQHITPESVKGRGLFPANSIILSTTATIGEHALLIADSLANQQFTFLSRKANRSNIVDIMYFFHYCFLLGDWCRANVNFGGLTAVNVEDLKRYCIKLPPIDEQRAIAHVLSTMDSDISALETKRDKYRQIKQGMMRDLLTGRIRLVETNDMERKSYTVSVQKNFFDGAIAAEPHSD